MNIWIFNHHALTPDMNGGTRHYDLAKELVKKGHSVTIVASSFHYAQYKEMKEYLDKDYLEEKFDGVDFVWLKTPSYFGNGFARVYNMLNYAFKALKIMPKLNLQKPDIIIGSSVHLFAVWAAYRLSLRYKVPFVMEVRDLWPQTLIDLGISKWHPFVLLLGFLERYLYKKADQIVSNLPFAYEYIEKIVPDKKVTWISNGVDLSNIHYKEKEKNDKFVITYTGALGLANNLQILLNVAKRLKEKSDIVFRIVGDGAFKEKLLLFAKENDLTNVKFENSVPKKDVFRILQESDVLYFPLKDSPVFNYGISSNKLFDYMAAGRVILFCANTRNNPLSDAGVGYTINPEDIDQLEKTILEIYNLSCEKRAKIGFSLRLHVEKNYATKVLANKLESLLLKALR